MLCGGRDGLGGWIGGWGGQVTAEVLEEPRGGWGVGQAAPALARAVEDCPDQPEARPFAGEPTDDLGPPAGLAEGALQQVGVADPLPVLGGEPQMHRELGERGGQAGNRGWVEVLVAG